MAEVEKEHISVDLLDDGQWSHVQKKYGLSPREIEVAREVCRGLFNEDVSKKLNMAAGTVKTHLRSVYKKVRVKSKICLLLRFIEDTKT